jgi:MFS family permease
MALTVFNLVSLFVHTPMGFITDRIGAWRMLIFALVLGGASFALLAATSSYAWLIVAMVAAGIANGVYHPADYALLSSSIEGDRLGKAFSIHTFAGFLGTAVTPAILLSTAGHFGVGPAFALAGIASLAVAIAILGARGVRHETHQKARAAATAPGDNRNIITPSRDLLVRAASPRGAEGRVFGVVSTGFNIAGAISPLIFGWLIDNGHNQGIFAFTALFMLLTGVVTILPVFGRK